MKELYRFYARKATDYRSSSEGSQVCLEKFRVLRETEKMYFIRGADGRDRRVLKGNGKRYAHEKIEWAYTSFKFRMKRWERHLELDLEHVRRARKVAKETNLSHFETYRTASSFSHDEEKLSSIPFCVELGF